MKAFLPANRSPSTSPRFREGNSGPEKHAKELMTV